MAEPPIRAHHPSSSSRPPILGRARPWILPFFGLPRVFFYRRRLVSSRPRIRKHSVNMVSVNLGLVHYVLDHIYGTVLHRTKLGTPFFSKGWGGTKLDLLEKMVKQLFPEARCQNWPPTAVQPTWKTIWETKSSCLREGVFRTTCDPRLIEALPPESHNARVAFLTPKSVSPEKMACVIHLAGTGDHSFERRLRLGGPLLKDNIATMVLESPYYGQRRPSMQHGSKLQCVSDLLLLGKATIDEARSLLYWLQNEAGYGKMGICGLSMGGVHAAMVGSLHPTPIATLPFLAPHSAVVPFCDGLYRHATAWDALKKDAATLAQDVTSLTEDAAHKSGITIEQVRERLRSVLSLTDVTRFPVPKNPQAVIFVGATDDGYIPKHSIMELQKAWPGSEVRVHGWRRAAAAGGGWSWSEWRGRESQREVRARRRWEWSAMARKHRADCLAVSICGSLYSVCSLSASA
uniref:Uncharacterized protein n=1 Tax=Oryza punctata TaxID=4537 RepID=A0A0E0JWS8_ORYPU